VSTKPEFESQDLRNIIRYILKVSGDMAECGLVYFWWGAGNERLSLDSTREDRITTVKNGTERSMKKLTAKMPKAQHLPLGHRIVQMKLVSNLMPPTQPAQAVHRRMGNEKATFPFKQYRLPLVNLVDTNQIMTKLQGFKRRGWPKLKRLSRAIHRNSRRVSLLRAQLSVLQSELKNRTSSRNRSMKTTMCKQKPTELELIPDRLYQFRLFFVQHYLKKCNARSVDGKRVDISGLAALLIDQFSCPPA
jgi:hypothetical protein